MLYAGVPGVGPSVDWDRELELMLYAVVPGVGPNVDWDRELELMLHAVVPGAGPGRWTEPVNQQSRVLWKTAMITRFAPVDTSKRHKGTQSKTDVRSLTSLCSSDNGHWPAVAVRTVNQFCRPKLARMA